MKHWKTFKTLSDQKWLEAKISSDSQFHWKSEALKSIVNMFQSQCLFLFIFLSYFIMEIWKKLQTAWHDFGLQNFQYLPQYCISIQIHYDDNNIPVSYPLKFACHGIWQISQKRNCCTRKRLFHLTLIVPFVDSSGLNGWWRIKRLCRRIENHLELLSCQTSHRSGQTSGLVALS